MAAEACQANEAVSVTTFELMHAHGGDCSKHAYNLFAELEAEYIPFLVRMYTKGTPQQRQLTKMYGIMYPAFD